MEIKSVVVERLITKFVRLLPIFEQKINESFLSKDLKKKYLTLLKNRLKHLQEA